MPDDAFAEVDKAGEALASIKVKDEVSEASGLDEDDENKGSHAAVSTREAKKSPARAQLKKKIAALKLPQSISDEQIEGWARMLERNPKKDKLLERLNDKLFSGNQKGLDVTAPPTDQKSKTVTGQQGANDGRGGHGERERGRARGRARQSDLRRRGHDGEMQKVGLWKLPAATTDK